MKPILKWQYEQLAKTLLLIQGHGSDPTCPCASEGEACMRKHLMETEALAQETIPIDEDKKHKDDLWTLAEEARALREDEERALCGKNRQQKTDITEWSRKWRKEFEGWSLACELVPARVDQAVTADPQAVLNIPSPFGWPGGKKHLANRIVAVIPAHKTYVEPFAGAASVFWRKSPSEVEVLNDKDADLMRFYRDLSNVTTCETKQISRDWDSLKARDGKLKACEFLAEVLCSFGCMRRSKADTEKCLHNAPQFHRYLPEYQARLAKTRLYCEDWQAVVKRYDASDTFFYFDPPYHGTSRGYTHGEDQLTRLAEVLPTLKGKWLLTYDDHPDVKKAFARFDQLPVKALYTLQAGDNNKFGKQLMIANFGLRAAMRDADTDIVNLSDAWPLLSARITIDHCEEARDVWAKYETDVKAGHTEAAQFWKGQAEVHGLVCATQIPEVGDMADKLRVICFETEKRGAVKPPFGLTLDIEGKTTYWTRESLSPNAPNCATYREVSQAEYIGRAQWPNVDDRESDDGDFDDSGHLDAQKERSGVMASLKIEYKGEAKPKYKPESLIYTERSGLLKAYRKAWAQKDDIDWWDTDQLYGKFHEVGYAGAFLMLWGYALDLTPAMFETHLDYVVNRLSAGYSDAEKAGQHKYAVDMDASPKKIVQAVAASDARQEFKDTVSGAYIRLNPDNMTEMLIFYGDEIAEAETDKEAAEILTHLRKHKKWPESAYVFDTRVLRSITAESVLAEIGREYDLFAEKPSYIDVWKTTITKHYRPSQNMHKGSIRTINHPGSLVIMGCPKSASWDGNKCSENQALVETHVDKTKKAMDEANKWAKKGVTVNYKTKQEGIQPRDPEPGGPGKELIDEVTEAVKKAEVIS